MGNTLGEIPQELKDALAKMDSAQLQCIQSWLDEEPFAGVLIGEYIEDAHGIPCSF